MMKATSARKRIHGQVHLSQGERVPCYVVLLASVAACASNPKANHDSGTAATDTENVNTTVNPVIISASTPRPRTGTWSVNYWTWPDALTGTETLVAALKPAFLRVGGYNNDVNMPDPFSNDQLDTMVAYARAIGAEPILQVPLLLDTTSVQPTAATAAAMIRYANITKA